jgi:hypothetical protein
MGYSEPDPVRAVNPSVGYRQDGDVSSIPARPGCPTVLTVSGRFE